ncbi:hypothetical protein PQX77_011981 [Marasmius sp. AFHP31]|nr:hypothetical protein PQX77_011981 [Marasmius sp. AFHP31]
MVDEHEKLLRNECGYTGPYPYWDWTIDADANSVSTSPVWDPVTGFGGNGDDADKCVKDGPYSDITLTIGTTNMFVNKNEPHCLTRDWTASSGSSSPGDMGRTSYDSEMMRRIYSQSDYRNMHFALEGRPHNAVHNRVGGEMGPHWAPNDPIFYMHHANVDRVWAKWQGDNATRLEDYSGYNDVRQTQSASKDDVMPTLNLLDKEVRVRDYLNTKANGLCYEYSEYSADFSAPSEPPSEPPAESPSKPPSGSCMFGIFC